MGHGTPRNNNKAHGYTYVKLQEIFDSMKFPVIVGTVEEEDTPNFEAVLQKLQERKYQHVHMYPLMVVAGDHANNDMAGADDDSWLSQFQASGDFESVECQIAGLGEIEDIQQRYIEHTKAAIDSLNG